MRDGNTCQYCGRELPRTELNLDHVVPRAQGGRTTWENVVCCCVDCNLSKGARTPEQAGLKLLKAPVRPRWTPTFRTNGGRVRYREWLPFLGLPDASYWNVELGRLSQPRRRCRCDMTAPPDDSDADVARSTPATTARREARGRRPPAAIRARGAVAPARSSPSRRDAAGPGSRCSRPTSPSTSRRRRRRWSRSTPIRRAARCTSCWARRARPAASASSCAARRWGSVS